MEFIRVEDCCEILDSQRKPITESERVPGRYPYYGANGIQGTINQYIFDGKLVLVAEDGGHFGSKTKSIAYLVNGKCWVNNHAHVLRAKKGFLAEYICYSLMFYKIEGYINGATRQKLTQAALRKLIIPKRSVEYQKAIVDRLDLVRYIIEKKQNIINELDLLIKSRFVDMFGDPVLNEKGWNLTSLESVCQSIYGGGTPSKKIKEYYMGTIPWVTSKDMKSDIIVDSIEHITQVAIDNSSTKIIPPESVLIVIRSGILKHTLPVCINKSRVTINQDLKALVLDERCKAIYLQYLLKALEKDILSGVRAVTADNIEFNSLKKRKIPIPPINIQIKFSQMVNQINKLKSDVQKSIDETQLLMDSLMQEYFG